MLPRLALFAALLLPTAAQAEGMPQLDFANPLTTSQVVWGAIIFAALVSSVARNPAARERVFGLAILGFALTEAVALYALVIAFIILFV
jgi:hypothetical protein